MESAAAFEDEAAEAYKRALAAAEEARKRRNEEAQERRLEESVAKRFKKTSGGNSVRLCDHPDGCDNVAMSGDRWKGPGMRCRAHGGGYRCTHVDDGKRCTAAVQGHYCDDRLCYKHGTASKKERERELVARWARDARLREKHLEEVWARQGFQCADPMRGCYDVASGNAVPACSWVRLGEKPPLTCVQLDHIKRVADGGDDSPSNLQALCACCHANKTAYEAKYGPPPPRPVG